MNPWMWLLFMTVGAFCVMFVVAAATGLVQMVRREIEKTRAGKG